VSWGVPYQEAIACFEGIVTKAMVRALLLLGTVCGGDHCYGGSGEDNGSDHQKNRLRFPCAFISFRPHSLISFHPHPRGPGSLSTHRTASGWWWLIWWWLTAAPTGRQCAWTSLPRRIRPCPRKSRGPPARSSASFLRVHWVAVPEELRARRLNREFSLSKDDFFLLCEPIWR
jgi:hypothetical protein